MYRLRLVIAALALGGAAVFASCSNDPSSDTDVVLPDAATADGAGADAAVMDADGGPLDARVDAVTPLDGAGGGDADDVDDAEGDTPSGPEPFDPAVCGAPAYDWLPADGLGQVVLSEEMTLSNLTPQAVAALLESAGSGGIVTPRYGVRNLRLRYTTQDRGRAVEATAALGIPTGLPAGESAPVVVWLHGLTGFNDDCAPSRDLADAIVPALFLASQGYISIAPDYYGMLGFGDRSPEGTLHPLLVGESVAVTSLDAIRATAATLTDIDGAPPLDPARVALFGGSQGGHAAFFTELYAPYYAPELTIRGVAAGLAPTDLIGHAGEAVGGVGTITAAMSAALAGMADWYGHTDRIEEVLSTTSPLDMAHALPAQMLVGCDARELFDAVGDVEDVFAPGFIAAVQSGTWDDAWPWGCVLRENSVGRNSVPRVSDAPFLLVDAADDTLVRAEVERASVHRLCDAGYRIEFVECGDAGHLGLAGALPRLLEWLGQRLDDVPVAPESQCVFADPVPCVLP